MTKTPIQISIDQEVAARDRKCEKVGDDQSVASLIGYIENNTFKHMEVEIDLATICLSDYSFKCEDLFSFIIHYKLVEKANLDYPVIVNRKGTIIDGRHRLVKAILEGKKKIKGIMFTEKISTVDV